MSTTRREDSPRSSAAPSDADSPLGPVLTAGDHSNISSSNRRVVRLTFIYNFVDGACYSMWGAQLLPVLLQRLSGDTTVGASAAASGLSQLVSATAAGYLGDRYARHVIIRAGAFFGLVALALFCVALRLLDARVFLVAQGVWGVYVGLASTGSEALFADVVNSGERTAIYSFKWMVQTLCYVVGYLVALVMLLRLGNDWGTRSIQVVMAAGLALHPVAMLVLCMMRDRRPRNLGAAFDVLVVSSDAVVDDEEGNDYEHDDNAEDDYHHVDNTRIRDGAALETASESPASMISAQSVAIPLPPPLSLADPLAHDGDGDGDGVQHHDCADKATTAPHQHIEVGTLADENSPQSSAAQDGTDDIIIDVGELSPPSLCRCWAWALSLEAVPYLVALVDFLMALGSGMSLVYIPLFLVREHGVTPVWLYALYLTSTCLTAGVSHVARLLAINCGVGRVPTVILIRTLGSAALLAVGLARGPLNTAAVQVVLVIARNSLMNAVMGMTRSVIMDVVQASNRAKWSAFESFSSFTWAGSAMIGGYLVTAHGYQFNFVVTAVFHLSAGLLLVPAAVGAHQMEQRAA